MRVKKEIVSLDNEIHVEVKNITDTNLIKFYDMLHIKQTACDFFKWITKSNKITILIPYCSDEPTSIELSDTIENLYDEYVKQSDIRYKHTQD